ncbi:MAG TPA: HAD hydrolase-like protein [Humibacter sp.]|nr:HAD hydrolase-like protein [Humibacter sp.]
MTDPTPTLTRTWTSILFDLDGTLTDSASGITSSLAATFTELGRPVPDEETLLAFVGPPLLDSLERIGGLSEAEAHEALEIYRRYANDNDLHGNAVIPGIAGVLEDLKAAGIPTAVATSKPESRAVRILEHFGLAEYFTVIAGASDDEVRSAKADVIAYALERLGTQGADLEQVVMVGDRSHDVVGATANGIPAIVVEWGYGSPSEATGAMAVVYSIDQLHRLLLG